MIPMLAIDPIWYAVGAYGVGAIIVSILIAKYFQDKS